MPYPPLLNLNSSAEYRTHFENIYCRRPLTTFDGINVRFRKSDFNHCFFESTNRDGSKDAFSTQRAERMDWIKSTLEDASAELFEGWDRKKKQYDGTRRVAVVQANYVVIIAIMRPKEAKFITAYFADGATISKIRSGPIWT